MTTAVLSVHLFLLALLLWVVCEVVVGTSQQEKCVYLDRARHLDTVGLSQDGDVIIGALINFYMLPPALDLSFTKEPYLQSCYEWVSCCLSESLQSHQICKWTVNGDPVNFWPFFVCLWFLFTGKPGSFVSARSLLILFYFSRKLALDNSLLHSMLVMRQPYCQNVRVLNFHYFTFIYLFLLWEKEPI